MKTLITLLALIISVSCFGQYQYKPKVTKTDKIVTVSLFTASIVLNALGDGLNDSNRKTQGHICNALSIGSLLAIPLTTNVNKKKWYIYPLSYAFIRFSTFNPVYNRTRNLPINYTGTTSIDDKFWNSIKQRPDLFVRSVSLVVGISLPLNEL